MTIVTINPQETLLIGEDNLIEIGSSSTTDGLKDAKADTYINDAATTFSIKDTDGAVYQGISGKVMQYVEGSNGRYQGDLTEADAAKLVEGDTYIVEVTALSVGRRALRRMRVVARYHPHVP